MKIFSISLAKSCRFLPTKDLSMLLVCLFLRSQGMPSRAQAISSPVPLANNTPLMTALGFTNPTDVQPLSESYSIKGELTDAKGDQYATLSLISRGLLSLHQEVFGKERNEVLVINQGTGTDSDDKGNVRKVHSQEAMKPFHLLPTPSVLRQIALNAEISGISTDATAGCTRFALSSVSNVNPKVQPQTFSLCVDLATHNVLYEEEPFSFDFVGKPHTLRRTFLGYSIKSNTLIPTTIQVTLDNHALYTLQITDFNDAPQIESSTFQVKNADRK
jgi:hypothetical protein